jgi:acyl-CoA thioesterase-2
MKECRLVNALPNRNDLEMLGIAMVENPLSCRFTLVPGVARHDGGLYGGTAIAASVVAMEAATQRPALWVTTQYISTARLGDLIECSTEIRANGRNITQVQVTGRTGDRILFVTVGATATPREDGLEGQYQAMPDVLPPESCEEMDFGNRDADFRGFIEQVEYRLVPSDGRQDAPLMMWSRLRNGQPATNAAIAFMADMVPAGIARSARKLGGGTSLDNSLRFGRNLAQHEWVLLELCGLMAVGAHAHGIVNVWSRESEFLAAGSQSANMVGMVDPSGWKRQRSGPGR